MLVAVNEAMSPLPFAAKPIDVVLLVQLYEVPDSPPARLTNVVGAVLHIV